jgi:hypothetical protein
VDTGLTVVGTASAFVCNAPDMGIENDKVSAATKTAIGFETLIM